MSHSSRKLQYKSTRSDQVPKRKLFTILRTIPEKIKNTFGQNETRTQYTMHTNIFKCHLKP